MQRDLNRSTFISLSHVGIITSYNLSGIANAALEIKHSKVRDDHNMNTIDRILLQVVCYISDDIGVFQCKQKIFKLQAVVRVREL